MSKLVSSRVNTAVRIRPISSDTQHGDEKSCITLEKGINIEGKISCDTVQVVTPNRQRRYTTDFVLDENITQEKVYDTIGRPIIDEVLKGYNGTILAYGQTSSGKTHTILGDLKSKENIGIIPRVLQQILKAKGDKNDICISISLLQIYLENVQDLLGKDTLKHLPVREDTRQKEFMVVDLSEHPITSYEQFYKLIEFGLSRRVTTSTQMNLISSRSHAVLIVRLKRQLVDVQDNGQLIGVKSTLYCVDLAGSENVEKSGVQGQNLRETKSINVSLNALGNVISAFADVKKSSTHIPYRDSVLTKLLQNSLGGNCKTVLICTVRPHLSCAGESNNTLLFAQKAMSIRARPILNKDVDYRKLCKQLQQTLQEKERKINELERSLEQYTKQKKSDREIDSSVETDNSIQYNFNIRQDHIEGSNDLYDNIEVQELIKHFIEDQSLLLDEIEDLKELLMEKQQQINIILEIGENEELIQQITAGLDELERWNKEDVL